MFRNNYDNDAVTLYEFLPFKALVNVNKRIALHKAASSKWNMHQKLLSKVR